MTCTNGYGGVDNREQMMFQQINLCRSIPYTWDDTLAAAARWMAEDSAHRIFANPPDPYANHATRGEWTEIDSLGRTLEQRLAAFGAKGVVFGQNIDSEEHFAGGYQLSEWMFRPEEKDLITSLRYQRIGLGWYYYPHHPEREADWWVMVVAGD